MSRRDSSQTLLSPKTLFSTRPDQRLHIGRMTMKTQETLDESGGSMIEVLRSLDQECKTCAPVSPLECLTNCNVWKLRNELRMLCETMDTPNFMRNLLNVLKNETRITILQTIVKGRYSVEKLQQALKKEGYLHSRDTLVEEYLRPLLNVGLATESHDQFLATTFGGRLSGLIENIPEFTNVLPSHSECYEEDILKALLCGPKTFEDVTRFVPSKIVSRVLKRLKAADLIETPEERDYVFFFRSKRDQSKESLAITESKVYSDIPEEGISAKRLAQKADLSLRRTYKYLRGLKGKKLIFARRTPKMYGLTEKGERLAWLVNELSKLVEETLSFSEEFRKHRENS